MSEYYSKYHKDWMDWLGDKIMALIYIAGFVMVFTWQWMYQNG